MLFLIYERIVSIQWHRKRIDKQRHLSMLSKDSNPAHEEEEPQLDNVSVEILEMTSRRNSKPFCKEGGANSDNDIHNQQGSGNTSPISSVNDEDNDDVDENPSRVEFNADNHHTNDDNEFGAHNEDEQLRNSPSWTSSNSTAS
jgi:hypothetical protein